MSLDMPSVDPAYRRSISTLPAEIDVNNADQVTGELLQALDERPAVLVADMTATAYCAVAGIHALTRAYHQAAGTELRVAARARIVRRVLELTRLNELAGIYPSLELALAESPAAGKGSSSPAASNDGARSRTASDEIPQRPYHRGPGRTVRCLLIEDAALALASTSVSA